MAFLEAKKAAEVDLKSRRAASLRYSSAQLTLHNLEFLHSLDLQPGRTGMKVRYEQCTWSNLYKNLLRYIST